MVLETIEAFNITISYSYLIYTIIGAVILRRMFLEVGFYPWRSNEKLYLHKEGLGEPILFLHGLTGSWRYWRRGIKKLSIKYALYCPDLLGFGRSPKPRGQYSSYDHLTALSPIIKGDNQKWTVMGHSMGAIIALKMLLRYPEKIKHMVLIGLPYYPSRKIAYTEFRKHSLLASLIISRSPIAPMFCYFKDILGLSFFAKIMKIPVDLYKDYWKHTWNSVSCSLFNTILDTDINKLLKNIGAENRRKIVLIHGNKDTTSAIQNTKELIATFPEITFKEMNGGHHIYLKKPDAINRLLFT